MAWEIIIPALASAAGGLLAGQGAEAAGDAQAAAAQQAAQLSKEIYYDQRGLARPGYVTGGAASNKLAAMFGIAPQDYEAAFAGANGLPSSSYTAAELGAGQPVAGHSGGGGRNALSPFLVRNGGDDWKTLQTVAPAGYDYDAYFATDPGLAREWAKPQVQALFGGNRNAYLDWHSKGGGGAWAPSPIARIGGDTKTTQPIGGAQQVGGSQASDPMAEFLASPYNKLATEMTDIDFGRIKSQLGASGKSISGPGEARYAKTLAGNRMGAFTGYTNALQSLAGMQQSAGSQISDAAGNYGARTGSALMSAGQARGNALAGKYAGYGQALSGVSGAAADYFKSPGSPTYGQPGYVDPARAAYPGQY